MPLLTLEYRYPPPLLGSQNLENKEPQIFSSRKTFEFK